MQKNVAFFVFFSVLKKRTEKNGKERIVLLGFISRQKLKKRMQKHVAFFKRTEKNGAFRMEKNAVPNPAFYYRKV